METKDNFLENYRPEGELLKIYTYPASVLTKKSVEVTEFNDELRSLCKNMLYTMYNAPGIGLAAPQVGKGLRLFVMDIDYQREKITNPEGKEEYRSTNFNPQIFINPKIKDPKEEVIFEEGCLSVPGIFEKVKRPRIITVEYQDIFGKQHHIEAHDLNAVCIQHENDHLEGIVFLDRLSLLKRNLLKKKIIKEKKKEETTS